MVSLLNDFLIILTSVSLMNDLILATFPSFNPQFFNSVCQFCFLSLCPSDSLPQSIHQPQEKSFRKCIAETWLTFDKFRFHNLVKFLNQNLLSINFAGFRPFYFR